MKRVLILVGMIAGAAPATRALAQAPTPAKSCENDPVRRQLDFWVGEWRVTPAGSDVEVGHSRVERISNGCAVLENWTGKGGDTGKSINVFNRTVGHWQQFYVGGGGGVGDFRDSHWDGPTLVYLAHSESVNGAPYLQRLSFSPLDSNTVRQFGEISTDDGKTWSVGYDFHYHRLH